MGCVFVSYRRTDAAGHAGRLHDSLVEHFGPDQVFQDYEDIDLGSDFVQAIEAAVSGATAVVVVIGPSWLTATLPDGRRRLDVPDDVVRLEVTGALRRGIEVIPVLVAGATVPRADELPSVLASLHRRNALEITDSRWTYDVGRLLHRLEKAGLEPVAACQPVRLSRATWRPWFRQQLTPRGAWRATVAVLSLLATVLGVYWGVRSFFDGPPALAPMTGDYNIAVAEFGAADARSQVHQSDAGRDLAQSLSDRLVVELEPFSQTGFDLQVRGPAKIARLRGALPEERARAAEAEARKINADLIVYGTLQPDGGGTSFTPEFYVSPQKLLRAEELVGQYELGSPVRTSQDIAQNIAARKELRDRLLGRTGALANFVLGLSYYATERPDEAARLFEAALAAPGWDDADGKEVLYLFLGNTAGKLRDFAAAERHFARALELEPGYARAHIGAGSVLFQQSRGSCEPGDVDPDALTRALKRFQQANGVAVQSPLADIRTKSAFGVGQVYLCLSQAQVADRWADAQRAFEQVIADYGGNNERVRNTAAEAYANIGFVELPFPNAPDAPERYRRALARYDDAAQLSSLADRQAVFHGMRGFILARLGERSAALAAYDEAIRLEPDGARRAEYEARRREVAGTP